MTDCKCRHPDHAHLDSPLAEFGGRCQYWIIKKCGDWIPSKEFGPEIKAWSMKIDYEGQCPCQGFTKSNLTKTPKNIKRIKIDISLENWLPKNKTKSKSTG